MAITKIQSESLNLADDYSFTGTITGAGGITETDQYILQGDVTVSGAWTLLNNWKRTDFNFEKIGTGITNTSGTFSFPSTGKYLIDYNAHSTHSSGSVWGGIKIQVTINNSTYIDRVTQFSYYHGSGRHQTFATGTILDVTDISNVKVRFYAGSDSGNSNWEGATDQVQSFVRFTKLGDT